MRDIIITKNSLTELNVFFYKEGLNNIHRPNLSFLKVDSTSRVEPIFHIGFKQNMGFIDSIKMYAGVMRFEVFEGYPLQSLMFFQNEGSSNLKYDLMDLEPIDFYCLQSEGKDPYGDFVIKNVKFVSTKMEQGVEDPSRTLIAEFVCTEVKSFKIPFFFNEFKSDNYNYHIIRNKKEIDQIKIDLINSENVPNYVLNLCAKRLGGNSENVDIDGLCELLDKKYSDFLKLYIRQGRAKIPSMAPIKEIADFIAGFYEWKNKENEKIVRQSTHLDFLNFKGDLL